MSSRVGLPAGRGFRRRLALAFVALVAVTSGALAVGAYAASAAYRHRAFQTNAEERARLALLYAEPGLSLGRFETLLGFAQQPGGFELVAVSEGVTYSSLDSLSLSDVPAGLTRAPGPGLSTARAEVDGQPHLVIAGRAADTTVYFFFSRRDLVASLDVFGDVLALGWLLAVIVAAMLGGLVARRTLRPVREAAAAAESMADGLLATRLDYPTKDEFGLLATSFNRMAEAVDAKVRELASAAERERRFTANVAHDLRTPLTSMTSTAAILEAELHRAPEEVRRPAELLLSDVARLRSLITELLELARFDAGQEEAELEVLRVREAVEAVLAELPRDADVTSEVRDDLAVYGDRRRTRRVLSNLLSNAIAHGAPPVVVSAERDGDVVRVHVRDGGRGIAPEDLPHLFDRFYRSDSSRSGEGSGLGLAIAAEHARVQGGSLKAGNGEGGGAVFTLTLRAAMAQDPATTSS